jgi:hypothetical protein
MIEKNNCSADLPNVLKCSPFEPNTNHAEIMNPRQIINIVNMKVNKS